MNRMLISAGVGAVAMIFMVVGLADPAYAPKPRDDDGNFLGNGYPSGTHYNLNLLGKKDVFTCPAAEYLWSVNALDDGHDPHPDFVSSDGSECPDGHTCTQGDQVFGNVIFMPRNEDGSNTDPISLFVESGAKGPKSKRDLADGLEVTDWCTESFPDDGDSPPPLGDGATFRLPKDPDGYAVYARILGKPNKDNDGPTFDFTSRELVAVEDEFGNDLLLLGLVDETGAFTPLGEPLNRTSGDGGGQGKGGPKGAKKAVEITQLFEFTGEVCYINDIEFFCPDLAGDNPEACTDRETPLCCVAVDLDEDGNLSLAASCLDSDGFGFCEDSATEIPGDGVGDDDGVCEAGEDCECASGIETTFEDNAAEGGNDDGVCDEGETCITVAADDVCQVTPVCKEFVDEWIFNIADFVTVLFGLDNDGSYIVKLRFYPLPLDIDAQG